MNPLWLAMLAVGWRKLDASCRFATCQTSHQAEEPKLPTLMGDRLWKTTPAH